MNLALAGKVCAITGPAKGMGEAITRAFAAEGCRLALWGRNLSTIEPLAGKSCVVFRPLWPACRGQSRRARSP
ncbi:MAG: hypothetical protein NZM07_12010 [Elioraea sp.]|nr:hypothetical protein [Elioraea sp.]